MMEEATDIENRQATRLYIALTRTYKKILAMDLRNIDSYGLNPTEFGVLEFLFNKGTHPLQQIGSHILITSGTITYVIDKLEKKGMIVRKPCEKDRRIIYAEITETGKQKMFEILPGHYQAIAQALSGLTSEEKEQAITLLKKISFSIEEGSLNQISLS
ncbi:MarR family winged helix-turn-helix transcriptional regulator [Sporomusa aerivorans]|uniref:MarR family winged helix-turn-helix transcriptional regulator n=1 Tax=Sporomusa aerivorans TaxID=204936 RepID=UPI00352AA41B